MLIEKLKYKIKGDYVLIQFYVGFIEGVNEKRGFERFIFI